MVDMVDEPYSFTDFGEDQAFSVEDMAPPVSDLSTEEDYNSFIMGGDSGPIFGRDQTKGFNVTDGALNPGQVYNIARGATATNPYPESFFSKLFGAENVDYTNILGSQGVADVNTLRARQGLGLPSLVTGKSYEMGDYYIGQPTIQGVVKEVPSSGIMGLLEKVPGISTLRTMLGGNRGLPSESERFKQAVKEAEENQINLPSFSFPSDANVSGFNLSDVINSVKAGITNLFDYPKPVQDAVSNMTESAFITPPSMSEDFGVTRPISFMDDTLNTGIASIKPTAMAEAAASMPEKRVEIADLPITTNAYKDLGFGIKAVNNEEKLPVVQRNVINAPEFLYTKRGLADPEYDVNPITNPFVDLKTIRAGGSGELKFSI